MAQSKIRQTRTTTSIVDKTPDRPPKGAKIKEQTERIETEQIENGWLITKTFSGSYWKDEKESDYRWFDYTKKWYSEEDPLAITVTDKSLAEVFKSEEE